MAIIEKCIDLGNRIRCRMVYYIDEYPDYWNAVRHMNEDCPRDIPIEELKAKFIKYLIDFIEDCDKQDCNLAAGDFGLWIEEIPHFKDYLDECSDEKIKAYFWEKAKFIGHIDDPNIWPKEMLFEETDTSKKANAPLEIQQAFQFGI